MTDKILLKDRLFNSIKVEKIAQEIYGVFPGFKKKIFVKDVIAQFPNLELKARISHIADCLTKHLPNDYEQAISILLEALPSPNNAHLSDDDFGDFIYATYAEFVVKNGCTKKYLLISLNALYEITQRFSAEDAIRYFINAFPKETLKTLEKWSKDNHYHVRRLCSEGTRPKLPWAQKIQLSIHEPIPILNQLFSDKTRFVTRSVANHINDISKIDVNLALETLIQWKKSGKQQPKEMEYILRHGLRTLIKQGNKKTMQLLGFPDASQITISNFSIPKQVKMNTHLDFSLTLISDKDTKAVVDYILYFQNITGQLKGKKVFKLKQFILEKNQPITLFKKHLLRENMTTRKLFPGQHEIEIQINGKSFGKKIFQLMHAA